MHVWIHVSSVAMLHELRDRALEGKIGRQLEMLLPDSVKGAQVRANDDTINAVVVVRCFDLRYFV